MNYKYHYLYCSLHFTQCTGESAVGKQKFTCGFTEVAVQVAQMFKNQRYFLVDKKKVEIVAAVPVAWISDILIVSKNVDRAAPPREAGSPVLHLARREEFANQDLI